MSILNDASSMRSNDRGGMSGHLEAFPAYLSEAHDIGRRAKISTPADGLSSILVLGMGGSAIGGELASGLLFAELRVPMNVLRGYDLPAYVGSDTLVLVSSYSGNTEETLSGYRQARDRGARIICSTTGGEVGKQASVYGHDTVTIPGGLPPRAALPYSLVPMLVVLSRLGLIDDPGPQIDDAVSVAEESASSHGLDTPVEENPAKAMALWLQGHIPVVYGTAPMTSVVANRWAGQFSENSKTIAHRNELPEMNHNEIVGWSGPRALAGNARVVFLKDEEDHARVVRRMEFTIGEVEASGAEARVAASSGATRLGRMISLVSLGDFTSFYLAMLEGVDPTPVATIDRLKSTLADFDG